MGTQRIKGDPFPLGTLLIEHARGQGSSMATSLQRVDNRRQGVKMAPPGRTDKKHSLCYSVLRTVTP